MRRPPAAAGLPLRALLCLWGAGRPSAGCAADALALVQGSLRVSEAAAASSSAAVGSVGSGAAVGSAAGAEGLTAAGAGGGGWDDPGSTIGDISPRMIDDEGSLAESAAALLAQRRQAEGRRALAAAAVSEAQVEVLSTVCTAALARVGASLDDHMLLTTQLKESLTGTKQGEQDAPKGGRQDSATLLQLAGNGSRQDRVADLENSLDLMQSIFQGWSTVGVVLRSSVQSMESKLETLGERNFAAGMGARLDDALSTFDTASQTTFGDLEESLSGISDESPDGGRADSRIRQMQRSLQVFCRSTNSFAHAFNQNMQSLAEAITARARQSNLREVELQRVGIVFDSLQQAADAVSWKIYSDAWTLTTGILAATADLAEAHEVGEAQASEDALAGGAVPSETAAPLKSSQAQTLTRAMVRLESQVDDLINHTRQEMRRVVDTVNASASKLDRSAGESLVMRAIDTDVFPEWKRLGDQLRSTSLLLTQCLENAGQSELAGRLYSLLDNNSIQSGLAHGPGGTGGLAAGLDAFLQRQDALAHLFYRAFAEFLSGLHNSPGSGRVIDQRTLLLVQKADGSDRDGLPDSPRRGQSPGGAALVELQAHGQKNGGLCAADGLHLSMMQAGSSGEETEEGSGLEQSDDALGAAAVQDAAAIAWKIHSAAWVLVTDAHKAIALLT